MEVPLQHRRSVGYTTPFRLLNGILFNISWFVIVISQSVWIAGWQVVFHLAVHFRFRLGLIRSKCFVS